MKKIFLLVPLLLGLFLCACKTAPEEQISALETYYLESPHGGNVFFEKYSDTKSCYAALSQAVRSELDKLGYRQTVNREEAQFVVAPYYYPETFEYPDPFARKIGDQGAVNFGTALNLTIRVTAASGQRLFSGDTRYKLVRENLNKAGISRQAARALRYFPPRAEIQK